MHKESIEDTTAGQASRASLCVPSGVPSGVWGKEDRRATGFWAEH